MFSSFLMYLTEITENDSNTSGNITVGSCFNLPKLNSWASLHFIDSFQHLFSGHFPVASLPVSLLLLWDIFGFCTAHQWEHWNRPIIKTIAINQQILVALDRFDYFDLKLYPENNKKKSVPYKKVLLPKSRRRLPKIPWSRINSWMLKSDLHPSCF